MHDADHPGGTQAPVEGNAPFGQFVRYQIGGTYLLEAQLRMGVNIAAHSGNGRCLGGNGVDDLHGGISLSATVYLGWRRR